MKQEGKNNNYLSRINSNSGLRSFAFSGAKHFNNLDYSIKKANLVKEFTNLYWENFNSNPSL